MNINSQKSMKKTFVWSMSVTSVTIIYKAGNLCVLCVKFCESLSKFNNTDDCDKNVLFVFMQ